MLDKKDELFFQNAYESYKKADDYIERFWEAFDNGHYVNLAKSKAQHDALIQGLLLRYAILCDDINPKQIDFIRSIVDSGDVLDFVRSFSNGEIDFSWKYIPLLKRDIMRKFVKILEFQLIGLADNFFEPFATVDYVIEKDSYDSLFKETFYTILHWFDFLVDKPKNENTMESLLKELELFSIFTAIERSWKTKRYKDINSQENEGNNSNEKIDTSESIFEYLKGR